RGANAARWRGGLLLRGGRHPVCTAVPPPGRVGRRLGGAWHAGLLHRRRGALGRRGPRPGGLAAAGLARDPRLAVRGPGAGPPLRRLPRLAPRQRGGGGPPGPPAPGLRLPVVRGAAGLARRGRYVSTEVVLSPAQSPSLAFPTR